MATESLLSACHAVAAHSEVCVRRSWLGPQKSGGMSLSEVNEAVFCAPPTARAAGAAPRLGGATASSSLLIPSKLLMLGPPKPPPPPAAAFFAFFFLPPFFSFPPFAAATTLSTCSCRCPAFSPPFARGARGSSSLGAGPTRDACAACSTAGFWVDRAAAAGGPPAEPGDCGELELGELRSSANCRSNPRSRDCGKSELVGGMGRGRAAVSNALSFMLAISLTQSSRTCSNCTSRSLRYSAWACTSRRAISSAPLVSMSRTGITLLRSVPPSRE
mmetsp:Transcript_72084/g.160323  ORF Transcript_72084/g.160323 Transcript_72084/m.160323 type:complete len:274 (-) Transcript_72084:84-905(-)